MEGITMRINFDRLSQLAGLPSNGNSTRRSLYEGKDPEDASEGRGNKDEGRGAGDPPVDEMMSPGDLAELDNEPTMEELMAMHNEDDHGGDEPKKEMMGGPLDEVIEVDEVMLVQELRRAKRIMNENKRRRLSESRRRNMFEAQLKQVIDEEVQNVMDEMNLNSQWVYGGRQPRRSRRGYTHQGSTLPGIGFRR